jgi:uncharacterized membrane protein YphA (DoxX/SURF4 family)
MAAQTLQGEQVESLAPAPAQRIASQVGFRFLLLYFASYCLLTQIATSLLPIPNVDIPDLGTFRPVRPVVQWVAVHVLRAASPPSAADTGSGDRLFDWTLVFCLLITAAVAAAIWSALDRKRESYPGLEKWFRVCIRICLAGQMMAYGMAKAIPMQMQYPNLYRLLEPYGNLSPMGVLWASIGASPAYETFAGCAELLGGILLIFPRTTMLGALVCLADMIQVFTLNMTYDVPVKLLSFHLILLSLFLLAPDFRRLTNFFFLDRATEPSPQPGLFSTLRANRIAFGAQIVIGIWLIGMNSLSDYKLWHQYGPESPKSALYGIWNVDQMAVDGQIRSPLINDYGRWRRLVFDSPIRMSFQRMDDSYVGFGAAIDTNKKTLALTKNDDKNWKANFIFERPVQDRLTLDGEMDGHKTHFDLHLMDRSKFLLVSRGFHWVQETPFNR